MAIGPNCALVLGRDGRSILQTGGGLHIGRGGRRKRMVHWTADGPTRAGSRLTMRCGHWLCIDSYYEEVEVATAEGGSSEFDVRNIRERRKALTAFTIFHLVAVD